MITSFGDSVLPVANAGQASWQRPHSVHENVSSTCFQVRSAASGAEPEILVDWPSRARTGAARAGRRPSSARTRH